MVKKELTKHLDSGEHVAVARSTTEYEREYAKEAAVVALKVPRRVYSGERSDWNGHIVQDGVKVRWVASGKEEVVGPRQVVAAWADHLRYLAELRERRESKETALAEQKAKCQAFVDTTGKGFVAENRTRDFKLVGYQVKLSPDEAYDLACELG